MIPLEMLAKVRYVTDANGDRTEVLVPLPIWRALVDSWQQLVERLEDSEERVILQEWLTKRAAGEAETVKLDEMEREAARRGIVQKIALGLEYARRGELLDGEAVFDELDRQDDA